MPILIFATFLLLLIIPAGNINATSNYSVSPLIIENTIQSRDSWEETIKITNTLNRQIRIYATVNEITLGENSEILDFVSSSMTDRTKSITSWIAINRGRIEIPPQSSIDIPVKFMINPNVLPGNYYAFIGFSESSNRPQAEEKVKQGLSPGVVVRFISEEKNNEKLKLNNFTTDRFIINTEDRFLSLSLENTGTVPLKPSGEIIFYDKRGREVASVQVDSLNEISSGEDRVYTIDTPDNLKIGRFKAFLSLDYGSRHTATIHDTVFFTVIPIYWLALIFAILLVTATLLAWYYYRQRYRTLIDSETDGVVVTVRTDSRSLSYEHDINLKN